MKDIILGQYSYLFNEELEKENSAHLKKLEEGEKKGYFMNSVRKALLVSLKPPLKQMGYTLADDIFSASLGTMTLFLEHADARKDVEVTTTISSVKGEEEVLNIQISQADKKVAKVQEFITGNISRDITLITDAIVKTIRSKAK
jgi:hypothetical protein